MHVIVVSSLWLCIILSAVPLWFVRGAGKKNTSGFNKHIAFISVAGHSSTSFMSAAAETLRNRKILNSQRNISVSFLSYEVTKHLSSRKLHENETHFFSGNKSPYQNSEERLEMNKLFGVSNLLGIARMTQLMANNYDSEVYDVQNFINATKPDLVVIDVFATSAIDTVAHMNIPYVIFYHAPVLGLVGIEDSLAAPDILQPGTDLTQQSLFSRVKKALYFPQLVLATMNVTNYLNIKRTTHGFRTYSDPSTLISNHPVLVTSFFGFEYARPVSPLIRMIGMYVDKEKFARSPQNGHDKVVLAWLNAAKDAKSSVVFAHFGTEAVPSALQLHALINGVLASGSKILLAVRHEVLIAANGMHYNDLILNRDENVTVVPWVPSQMVLQHKAVNVFISHGGAQSIAEAIYGQVPLLMLPMNSDRNANAARVTDAKIGLRLDQNTFTAENVTAAVLQLQQDIVARRMRRRMQQLKKLNELAGECDVGAAKAIEEYLEYGYDHLVPFTIRMNYNPLAATGLDALLVIAAVALFGFYLFAKVVSFLFFSGRSEWRTVVINKDKRQ